MNFRRWGLVMGKGMGMFQLFSYFCISKIIESGHMHSENAFDQPMDWNSHMFLSVNKLIKERKLLGWFEIKSTITNPFVAIQVVSLWKQNQNLDEGPAGWQCR